MEMNTRFGDILLESGLDEAFRALAAESPEWLAVLIETEGRMRHDEDFVRRFEAKDADVGPRIREWFEQQQAAGKFRDDVSWVEIIRFTTALLNGLALRVASGDQFDIDAMLSSWTPRSPQGEGPCARSSRRQPHGRGAPDSAAPAATDDERDLGAAREPAAA